MWTLNNQTMEGKTQDQVCKDQSIYHRYEVHMTAVVNQGSHQ